VNDPVIDKYDLSILKSIQCGGAALPDELAKKANIKFRIPIAQGYGLTETSPSTNSSPFNDIKIGSTGVLCCNTELKVLDVQTGQELGYNQEGELCFRGPQIMKGYLNNPSATKEIIKDGWLHSGDIGYIDTDGHIFITDRLKELIKYKGNQVPPAYLEDIIFKQIGVEDCAVIGVPDTEAGELPKAFVVLKQGAKLTEQDVMQHVSAVVSPHKRVRLVEFIDAIPRSASGKILRRTLREREKQRLMKSKL
jgi:acyl-CoA synthetase (AMP-forming)/AMP-acid ligase II